MNQPTLIELKHPVAILDEHLLKDERGQEVCYLNDRYLNRIAQNNNRRIEESGDMAPVVIGHTEDGRPETRQPPLIGYAYDFFVSGGKRQGTSIIPTEDDQAKKYLFARWKIFKDRLEELHKFPRRSVELWTSRWEVDPISILGATTPDRDLGLIRFARDGSSVVIPFNPEESEMPEDREMESNEPLTLAQLQQTEEWQFLQQLKEELEAESQMADQEVPADEGGEVPPEEGQEPEEEVPVEEGQEGEVPAEEEPLPEEEGEPIRHSAGYPGSTSTFVPVNKEPSRMARENSDKIRLARLERQLSEANQVNQAFRIRLARSERTADFLALEAEGVSLDIEDELNIVAPLDQEPMDEPRYQAHLDKIRKNYRRSQPSTLPFDPTVAGRVGTSRSADERKSLVQKALKEANGDPSKYDQIIANGSGEKVR